MDLRDKLASPSPALSEKNGVAGMGKLCGVTVCLL